MKYTQQSVYNAIFYLVPKLKVAHEGGVEVNIPMTLPGIAQKYLMEQWEQDRRDFNESFAYYICREALLDLHEKGWMEFGDNEWEASL